MFSGDFLCSITISHIVVLSLSLPVYSFMSEAAAKHFHNKSLPAECSVLVQYSVYYLLTDVEPGESYLISVFPIYEQQFGSPQSLNASLQQGGKYAHTDDLLAYLLKQSFGR